MNNKPFARHSFRFFTVLALALTFAACSGGSGGSASPTGPSAGPVAVLSTQWGDVTVETNGYPVNFDKALDSVIEGYERARGQIGTRVDGMRLDGYRVVVMPPNWELNGQHLRSSREIRMRAGIERVLVHELQHLFAWELDRFSDCKTQQDHPEGYDLHCRRLS
ncbi:MAG TPA: hypothetical protein VMR44_11195 [Thermoanaerobaculia bacterium]|nr:hypothetical protein [Thermoanaerobaculia bacterium]